MDKKKKTHDRKEENGLGFNHVEFYGKVGLGSKNVQTSFRAMVLKFRANNKTPKQQNQEDDIPYQ